MDDEEVKFVEKMNAENFIEELIEELEEGLGNGPLTLGIYCTKCSAQFELGREGAAMAILTQSSFLEYLKWIQSRECPACNKE